MGPVEAIFENGVFKPVNPVALPDKQRVEMDVRLVASFDMSASRDHLPYLTVHQDP